MAKFKNLTEFMQKNAKLALAKTNIPLLSSADISLYAKNTKPQDRAEKIVER